MMRRKNLERAIVLGLLLSTGVYGSAWAEEIIDETITDSSHNRTYNQDVIVDAGNNSAIEIGEDTISISTTTENLVENETGKIELNSNKYGIRLDGSGSVSLTAVGDNVIKVTANSTDDEIGDGINVTENAGGTITLNGANNTITVEGEHSDGIYTATGNSTNINLIATTGSNTITATNNGIDHRGNNTITLEANDGSNIIKTTNGDGIRVDGNGTVEFNAQNNEITAGDNGIQIEGGGTVNLTATGNNTITANTNGIYASGENSTVNLSGAQGFIKVENSDKDVTGIYVDLNANVDLNTNASNNKKLEINAISTNANATGVHVGKLTNEKYGTVTNTNAIEDVSINASSNIGEVTGVSVIYSSKFKLINLNTFTVNALTNSTDAIGISSSYESEANVNAQGNILVNAKGESNEKSGVDSVGIAASTKASITLTSNNGNIIINNIINEDNEKDFNELKKSDIGVQVNDAGKVDLEAKNISISGKQGVLVAASSNKYSAGAEVNIKSVNINDITATVDGISVKKTQKTDDIQNIVNLDAKENYINVNAGTSASMLNGVSVNGGIINIGKDENITSNLTDIRLIGNADKKAILYGVRAATVTGIDKEEGQVNIESKSINVTVVDNANGDLVHGISNNKGIVDFDSDITKIVVTGAKGVGINSQKEGIVTLNADSVNLIYAGELNRGYGKSYAINATGQSDVDLTAGETNLLRGAVYASGHSDTAKTDVKLTGGANMVLSNAYIDKAGSLTDKKVISALYAEKGAHIKLDGDTNLLGTYAVSSSDDLERVVWAYETADIDITGLTAISTDSYDLATNSKDIAVVAGTATGLEDKTAEEILGYSGDRANVDINYESDSSITGDILSAYAGTVNIAANTGTTRAPSDSKIDIRGNLLAGNNGILDVNLGNGGTLTGRADDYGDAGLDTGHGAATGTENSFFNPAFSSEIIANGTVNLTMGEGSVWNVTGQSWITKLNTTENAADTLINLENAKEDYNTSASALTIGTLNGSTQFYMNLDGDRSASDMLYIKNANGKYDIYLQEEVTTGEINENGFKGLRFATVGEGSNADFTVKSQGTGSAFDVVYTVGTDSYEGNSENTAYNSTTNGSANTEKPGNDSVDNFFGLTNTATEETPEAATNGIMLMAENEEAADNAANANSGLDKVTNFKIIARADEELNDTGETILNMSRANYSNAIYMDRLNKRLGEARYINDDPEEDEGMWVRIRHDRIGKDDAYRSQNTMYELGYDKKQDCDNGERRVGFAVDYMHGDTGYTDIAGKGEIDRYGLWLYDTWMGDKGHYVDYVAKWGHLDNDFEVYTMRDGNKVTGDYSNNVFSVSAEYGRKKDIGNDWYFEPQAQLQLARVTGAEYTTNQGTKVSVDGINSLIGRAGFRIGKDFGEEKQSTLYFKADVLHEFLGDQDVYVMDKSTDNKWAGISYDNEGTWYDIGIGYAAMMSKSSYAFIDLEQSFGNDNDDTYQINAGVRWTF